MTDRSPTTDRPNAAMADNWNGAGGSHWVNHAARHDRALAAYGRAVLDAAAVAPGDHVLDVGCGTGALTRAAARLAEAGTALGVDIGRPMVEHARRQAADEGVANVAFAHADAQVHPFAPGTADVAVSRFGVMFFDDPVAAFANIRRAVREGGRLAFVCWQSMMANDWLLVPFAALAGHVGPPEAGDPDAPGPFSLAEPDRVGAVLTAGGFADVELTEVAYPMWLGSDVDDAVGYMRNQTIARAMFDGKPAEQVERAVAALRHTLEGIVGPEGIELAGRAWLVTAQAA